MDSIEELTDHPEHDILFIATQVARAAGLKAPTVSVSKIKNLKQYRDTVWLTLADVPLTKGEGVKTPYGKAYTQSTGLLTESQAYVMLIRGNASASEPFRKWVTEEVLPSIRKAGSYNVNDSETQTGQ